MTQQEVMSHPYWGKFQQRLGPVINGMTQRGMVSPNESQLLVQLLRNSYPQLHSFIERICMNYPEMTDQQMDSEIFNMLSNGAIQTVKAKISQMSGGGFGGGGWGSGGGFGGGWGGGNGFGRPVGFGYDRGFGGGTGGGFGIPSSPFSGGNTNRGGGANFEAPQPSATSIFGGGTTHDARKENIAAAMRPDSKTPASNSEWKTPKSIDEKSMAMNGVTALINKFELSTGEAARRVIIHDSKVGYTSDSEVLEKYKSVFTLFPDSRRKFLTIAYQQLKLVKVNREEFVKMAMALSVAVSKANDVESKLRAILATLSDFNHAAYGEFTRIFLDELELHIQCGELCDSHHPKNILNRPDSIEDVLAWVTGDINKDMLAAMHGMEGFEKRLNDLLSVLIDGLVASLPKIILDTKNDTTMLDDFYRALPGIWTNDCGMSLRNTEDLFNLFLATRETIESSKSANAIKAESVLRKKLDELGKQFTMIFLPRVVSWCNYSKADVCRYDEKGNCQPDVFPSNQPRNDVEFFVEETLEQWDDSRDTRFRWSPKNLLMEIDEETYCLQYGRTTNNPPFICSVKYWHD